MANPPVPPPLPLFSSPKIFQFKEPCLDSLPAGEIIWLSSLPAGEIIDLHRPPSPILCLGATSPEPKSLQHLARLIDPHHEAQTAVKPNSHSLLLKLGVSVDLEIVAEMVSSAVHAIDEHLPKLYGAARSLENEPIDRFVSEFGEGFKGQTREIVFLVHNVRELIQFPGAAVVVASPVADNYCARGWEKIEEVRELLKRLSLALNDQDTYYEFISDLDALYSAIEGWSPTLQSVFSPKRNLKLGQSSEPELRS